MFSLNGSRCSDLQNDQMNWSIDMFHRFSKRNGESSEMSKSNITFHEKKATILIKDWPTEVIYLSIYFFIYINFIYRLLNIEAYALVKLW